MKRWLALGCLSLTVIANAEPAMVADKGVQGQVVLTAERHHGCPGGQRIAYLTRRIDPDVPNDRITYWGCWKLASAEVKVHYFVGADRSYHRDDFSYAEVQRANIPKSDSHAEESLPAL